MDQANKEAKHKERGAVDVDDINFGEKEDATLQQDEGEFASDRIQDIEEDCQPSYLNAQNYMANKSGPGDVNRGRSND